MKRILIFSHAMGLGGAERSLLGLLDQMDPATGSVDLFLMRQEGELLQSLPEHVNLLPEIPAYAALAVPFSTVLRPGTLRVAYGRLRGKMKAKKRVKKLGLRPDNGVSLEYSHKYTLPFMPEISQEEYDLAVSFLTPHYFVADRVHAQKKMAWIHTDYAAIDLDAVSEYAMWDAYDHIVSISESVTKGFLQRFPKLKDKMVEIGNILPEALIRRQADESAPEMREDGTVKLLSVGRFCRAKNFDQVPDICAKIRLAGINVKWYLIGFGGDEALIRQKIAESGMGDFVVILGKKTNPYPYLKRCDLYVQPSRYEGHCVTVREAQMLGKPVVITNYETASSQLTDGVDGVIVPLDNQGCADGMIEVIQNEKRMEQLVKNTRLQDYTNQQEISTFYQMMEEGENGGV